MLFPVNFNTEMFVYIDESVNLAVQIVTNSSLINDPNWSRHNADLPDDSHVINYGNHYTSLIIDKVSYSNDGGMYTLCVANHCGSSSLCVVLIIYEGNELIMVMYVSQYNEHKVITSLGRQSEPYKYNTITYSPYSVNLQE